MGHAQGYDLRLFFLQIAQSHSSTTYYIFLAKQINPIFILQCLTMSKPVFTDDREKQEPVLGDGDVDATLFGCATGGLTPPGADVPPLPKLP